MARIFLLLLSCVWVADAQAQEVAQSWFVAFDQESARLLPAQRVLGILVQDQAENYDTINARALAMRHAHYFVYQAGGESTLAAMYRERLQTHGVVPVELPRPVQRRSGQARAELLLTAFSSGGSAIKHSVTKHSAQ